MATTPKIPNLHGLIGEFYHVFKEKACAMLLQPLHNREKIGRQREKALLLTL